MEKMSTLTFPDGSQYEVTDAEARLLISQLTNKIGEMEESFQDGCSTIASAITEMGVTTANNASPATMADNIKKIKSTPAMTTLWTNPKSASDKFAAQTVSVNLSAYTYAVIEVYGSDAVQDRTSVIIKVGSSGNLGGIYKRTATVSTSNVIFSACTNTSYTTAYAIPYKIYGLK